MKGITWADRPVVYRYYNADAELLYIGSTGNVRARHHEHMRRSSWASEVSHTVIRLAPTIAEAREIERRAIAEERPRHNVHHVPLADRALPHAIHGPGLRTVRLLLGLSQQQLGRQVGLDQAAISRLEQGNRGAAPRPETVAALSNWCASHGIDRRTFILETGLVADIGGAA